MRAFALSSLAAAGAQISVFESGASGAAWAQRPAQSWDAPVGQPSAISIDRAAPRQEVLGFGACFTDTAAYNAMVFMEDSVRGEFVEAMWGESGLKASLMRMHINSPDYAVHSYNLDNVTDDFELAHFDDAMEYDSQRVLPLARLALAKAASWGGAPLKLFGSPWSPPGWMKNNNKMINSDAVCLKNDTAQGSYIQTWANYMARWVVAVEAHLNVSLYGITPQNEPEARQSQFESCAYDVPHYVEWVGKYLGPAMAKAAPHVKILAYDHNKADSLKFVEGLAGDADGVVAWHGTAVHWYDYFTTLGLEQLDGIHALNPALPMINTEACFLDSLTMDWDLGLFYALDIIGDLSHWVGGWLGWNAVLLSGDRFPESYGGPNQCVLDAPPRKRPPICAALAPNAHNTLTHTHTHTHSRARAQHAPQRQHDALWGPHSFRVQQNGEPAPDPAAQLLRAGAL